MPIKVACQCGQRLSAKDELLGKRVKCPKCGGALTIRPAPAAAVIPLETPAAAPAVPAATAVPQGAEFTWPEDLGPAAVKPATAKSAPSPAAADARGWIAVNTGLTICFLSLIVGGGGYAIIAITALVMMTDPETLQRLVNGGGGGLASLLVWPLLAWLASCVSLATGWGVCCAVPKASKTRAMIQAVLGCVGAAIGMVLLMHLSVLAMAPSVPSPASIPPPRNPADVKRFQADVDRAAKEADVPRRKAPRTRKPWPSSARHSSGCRRWP